MHFYHDYYIFIYFTIIFDLQKNDANFEIITMDEKG